MDTVLYSTLLNGDLASIKVIQQAGCVLSKKVNTIDQNLLILSLYQSSLSSSRYQSVVKYLLDNDVDPGQTDRTSYSKCGIFTRVFSCCGCNYFDYLYQRCSLENRPTTETSQPWRDRVYQQYKSNHWLRGSTSIMSTLFPLFRNLSL